MLSWTLVNCCSGIVDALLFCGTLRCAVQNAPAGSKLIGVRDVALEHWNKYGRNFFR